MVAEIGPKLFRFFQGVKLFEVHPVLSLLQLTLFRQPVDVAVLVEDTGLVMVFGLYALLCFWVVVAAFRLEAAGWGCDLYSGAANVTSLAACQHGEKDKRAEQDPDDLLDHVVLDYGFHENLLSDSIWLECQSSKNYPSAAQ